MRHLNCISAGFNPWDRVTTVDAVRDLLLSAGVSDPLVEAEEGHQSLRTVDDWSTIATGSGFVWTVNQMSPQAAERVRCYRPAPLFPYTSRNGDSGGNGVCSPKH